MSDKTAALFEAALESLQRDITQEIKVHGLTGGVPCEYGLDRFVKRVRAFHGITDLLHGFGAKCEVEPMPDRCYPAEEAMCETRPC